MMVWEAGRCSGASPSQSYARRSTTTLFIAVKALSPSSTSSVAAVILGNNYAAPVRIKQNLSGIEPHAVRGIEWPVDSIPV